jgi:hypothetical protein
MIMLWRSRPTKKEDLTARPALRQVQELRPPGPVIEATSGSRSRGGFVNQSVLSYAAVTGRRRRQLVILRSGGLPPFPLPSVGPLLRERRDTSAR